MNRKILLTMLAGIIPFLLFSTGIEKVKLNDHKKNELKIVKSDSYTLKVRNLLSEIEFINVKAEGAEYTELHSEGYSFTEETGAPALPVLRKLIEVPQNASLKVNYEIISFKEYHLSELGIDYMLMPRQPSMLKCEDTPPPFEKNERIYNQNAFWRTAVVNAEDLGMMRDCRIARLDIAPFSYNPQSGIIRVYDEILITISFEGADLMATQSLHKQKYSPYFEGLKSNLLNYSPQQSRDTILKNPVKYVIVSDRMFEEQLQPFIEWKTKKGYTIVEAYTDDPQVGTTTNSIKSYLQSLYDAGTANDPAPSFVLFVGDVQQIPAWSASGASDLYYCEYTDDYFPEIYYGRFSAQNPSQLQPQIDKTLQYEQFTMPDPSYMDEVVLVAGVDGSHGHDWGNGQINYGTINYFNAAHGITAHAYLYPESGNHSADIIQNISDGVGFGNYTAHCSSSGWADPSFSTSDIPGLENQDKYGLLIGNCCSSVTFDANECFGEAILRAENKGAVGYIGGSNSTYWDEDYYFGVGVGSISENPPAYEETTMGAYDASFHDHGESYDQWYITNDQMLFAGNLAVTEGAPSSAQYYWDIYHLMGDPSVMNYFGVPEEMIVSYDGLMPLATTSFTIQAAPYAYAAISKDGVLHGAAMADENGTAVVTLDPITIPGEADVIVTAQNKQPYIGTVVVSSPDGPYVLLDTFVLDDNAGNQNALADYGENILLNVSLKNLGNADANNVSATLVSTDPYVSIISDNHDWGLIPSQESLNQDAAFEIQIADSIPDQYKLQFELQISDNNESWSSSMSIMVNAPVLAIGHISVDDATSGNNNGRLDPGEMADLIIPVSNTGSSASPEGMGSLISNSSFIIVNSTNDDISAIDAGGSADCVFSITVDPASPVGSVAEINFEALLNPYEASKAFFPKIGLILEDFETGDFEAYNWEFSGDAEWLISDSDPQSGAFSAQSGDIDDEESSILKIEMEVLSDDSISFFRKVSSEDSYDYLKFYIDNTEMGSWAGESDWAREAYFVNAGTHTFKWEYDKDYSVSNGGDCGWVDYIIFPSTDASGGELAVNVTANPEYSCGGRPVQLMALPSGGNGTYTYSWTPTESLDDPTVFNPVASPSEPTTYSVVVDDGSTNVSSEIFIDLLPLPQAPIISQVEDYLTSGEAEGNQWYFEGEAIEGANAQTYTPLQSGNYYATVTNGSCESDPSNTIYFVYTGTEGQQALNEVSVYPLPAKEKAVISLSIAERNQLDITVYNALGKEVASFGNNEYYAAGAYEFVVEKKGLQSGVYYCRILCGNTNTLREIIFKN